jgi:uncharacterized protein (DUF1810 family)
MRFACAECGVRDEFRVFVCLEYVNDRTAFRKSSLTLDTCSRGLGYKAFIVSMGSIHMQDDPFNLDRFTNAQAKDYPSALAELRAGKKVTHWIWYVLPQLRGLGTSSRTTFYGIGSADEARAYLAHPVLGPRLTESVAAMNALHGLSAVQVLGPVDAAKFRSCLTLFLFVEPQNAVFREALDKYFAGIQDEATLALLRAS